jgi:hypothetical protein
VLDKHTACRVAGGWRWPVGQRLQTARFTYVSRAVWPSRHLPTVLYGV